VKSTPTAEPTILESPESYPIEMADMVWNMIKSAQLLKYVVNEHGQVAEITPAVLKAAIKKLMDDHQDMLVRNIDPEHLVTIAASDRIRGCGKWNAYQLADADTTIAVDAVGTKCRVLDLKRVNRAALQFKYGLPSTAFDNNNYNVFDQTQPISRSQMNSVVQTLEPAQVLQLAAWCCSFFDIEGQLLDASAEKFTQGVKNKCAKLVRMMEMQKTNKYIILDAIPKEAWMNASHDWRS